MDQRHYRDIKKYFKLSDSENTTHRNMLNVVKTVVSEKCIALNAYFRKGDIFLINNLLPS